MSNRPPIASPMPAMTSKTKPILPPVVFTSNQIAYAKVQALTAQEANMSDNTQPYCPLAYSLTIRQEGAYSGLSMCKAPSKASIMTAAPNDSRAATCEPVIADTFEALSFDIASFMLLLLFLQFVQNFVETVKPVDPKLLKRRNPVEDGLEPFRIDPVHSLTTCTPLPHQPNLLQHLEVF